MRTPSSSIRRHHRPSRAALHSILAVGLLVALTACGEASESSDGAEQPVRPGDLLITAGALPEGWSDSNSQGTDYRVTVCGVDLEPTPPTEATSVRFSRSPVGPFLEQHVRVHEDSATVQDVVDRLDEALRDCTEYEATSGADGDNHHTARFEVEPLTVEGAPDDSVAWRQTSQGDVPITSDLLLVPRGTSAVMLMSYALRDTPEPDVLSQAVAALPEEP